VVDGCVAELDADERHFVLQRRLRLQNGLNALLGRVRGMPWVTKYPVVVLLLAASFVVASARVAFWLRVLGLVYYFAVSTCTVILRDYPVTASVPQTPSA